MPVCLCTKAAKSRLLARLISRHFQRKAASSAYGSSRRNCARSLIQSSPMVLRISPDNRRLLSTSQRRGVTPLVMLVNFSGHSSWKSRSTSWVISRECSSATPLIEWLPTASGTLAL